MTDPTVAFFVLDKDGAEQTLADKITDLLGGLAGSNAHLTVTLTGRGAVKVIFTGPYHRLLTHAQICALPLLEEAKYMVRTQLPPQQPDDSPALRAELRKAATAPRGEGPKGTSWSRHTTPSRLAVLKAILAHGGWFTAKQIANTTERSPATVNPVINEGRERGYLEHRSVQSSRAFEYCLTNSGKQAALTYLSSASK